MKLLTKVALVLGGYVAAFAIALAATSLYIAATGYIDRQTYSGMTAFGDSVLFLFAFAAAAVVPTGAALFFLRPYRRFWSVLSVVAVTIAATGLAACLDYVLARGTPDPTSFLYAWSALAVLRLLIAPICAGGFLLAAVFAPSRRHRNALLLAMFIDGAGFAVAVFELIARTPG